MVTRQEYAQISEAVYGGDHASEIDTTVWKQIDLNGNLTTEYIDSGNGFQGAYYRKDSTGEVVVAFRGTEVNAPIGISDHTDLQDIAPNDVGVGVDYVPTQYNNALKLYQDAVAKFGAENVTVTGHSLGGILTQLVCAKTGATGVTFNPGGTQHLLDDIGANPNSSFTNITNYSTANNFLNYLNIGMGLDIIGTSHMIPSTGSLDSHADFDSLATNSYITENQWRNDHQFACNTLNAIGRSFQMTSLYQYSFVMAQLLEGLTSINVPTKNDENVEVEFKSNNDIDVTTNTTNTQEISNIINAAANLGDNGSTVKVIDPVNEYIITKTQDTNTSTSNIEITTNITNETKKQAVASNYFELQATINKPMVDNVSFFDQYFINPLKGLFNLPFSIMGSLGGWLSSFVFKPLGAFYEGGTLTYDESLSIANKTGVIFTDAGEITTLSLYDSNQDGKINAQDSNYGILKVWNDINEDGIADTGEIKTLSEAGVVSISLEYEDRYIAGNGNFLTKEIAQTVDHNWYMSQSGRYTHGNYLWTWNANEVRLYNNGAVGTIGNDTLPSFWQLSASGISINVYPTKYITGAGDDNINGNSNNNEVYAGTGNDTIFTHEGNDYINAEEGNDWIGVGAGNDKVFGEAGNDVIFGEVGNDTIYGGDDDDELQGFTTPGTALKAGETDNDFIFGESGNDTIAGQVGDDRVYGGVGNDFILGFTFSNDSIQALNSGETDNDKLYGGAGNDTILGQFGDDYIDGGANADSMEGGAGNDIYIINTVNDVILERQNEGNDTVLSSVTYLLNSDTENLILLGDSNIHGTGNKLNNNIKGTDGDNILDGVTGVDTMTGYKGNDIYYVDNSNDIVVEKAEEGIDTVQTSISYTLADNTENLTLLSYNTPEKGLIDGESVFIYGYPKRYELDYMQGDKNPEYKGTCALTSVANLITQSGLSGSEEEVVDYAVQYNLCITASEESDPHIRGGANWEEQINILSGFGIAAAPALGFDANFIANKIKNGHGVILGVSSDVLWKTEGTPNLQVDHVVTVSGVVYNTDNTEIKGFYICDSGRQLVSDMTKYLSYDEFVAAANVTNSYAIYTTEPIKLWDINIDGIGNSLDNKIIGNEGQNVLNGSTGIDIMIGGKGSDTYIVDNTSDTIVESTSEGIDVVNSSVNYTLSANVEDLELTGANLINGHGNSLNNHITGNSNANNIYGNDGDDLIDGANGIDTLWGGNGNDTLDGGILGDKLYGGDGNDIYVVDNTGDILSEDVNHGNDQVKSSISYTLNTNIENLILTGNTNLNGYGNELGNNIQGNIYNNSLYGYIGNDTLIGGSGIDSLYGHEGNDYIDGGTGNDSMWGHDGQDTLYGGSGSDKLMGMNNNDYLYGGDNNDSLYGHEGNDSLNGGLGDDYLNGDIGDDIFYGEEGKDSINGGAGKDTIHGDQDNDTVWGYDGNDLIYGGDGDDSLMGKNDNDTIYGDGGNDSLYGDGGNDSLYGGLGNDEVSAWDGDDYAEGGDGNDTLFGGSNDNGSDTLIGDAGIDEIYGYGGNDHLYGGLDNDSIWGSTGIDNLYGEDGNDSLCGNEDNDYIDGGKGDDILWGGSTDDGNDTLLGGAGIDKIYGNGGNDYLHGGDNNDSLYGHMGNDSLYGGLGDDYLNGDIGDDIFYGEEGKDSINGGAGKDTIHGDQDNDIVWGNEGNDLIYGGDGDDSLGGLEDNDEIHGDEGNDSLYGDGGNDSLYGGLGNDEISAWDGYDYAEGGDGNDSLWGGNGNDTLLGGAGIDKIYGNEGNDYLHGGDDNDSLYGNEGNDLIYGGDGDDSLGGLEDNDEIHGDEGNDSLYGDGGNDSLYGGLGNDEISAWDGNDYAEGGDGDDTLWGGSNDNGNDTLLGGAGIDKIYGNGGNDNLDGGIGIDSMYGGAGNDTYVVDNSADYIYEYLNEGVDNVESSINHTLKDNFENLILTGNSDLSAVGNASANTIVGNSGNNILDGLSGIDIMIGEAGNDIYYIDNASDDIWEDLNNGIDEIKTSVSFELSNNVENLTLLGSSNIDAAGNILNNTITGNSGDNRITGNDYIEGLTGNDLLYGDSGSDSLLGGSGNDTLYGESGNDTYTFDLNDGIDTVQDLSGEDKIIFKSDSIKNTALFFKDDTDLYIDYGSQEGANQIIVQGKDSIERVELSNGYYLTNDDINLVIQDVMTYASTNGIIVDSFDDVRGCLKSIKK